MDTILEQLENAAADTPPSLPLKLLVVADCVGRASEGPPVQLDQAGIKGLFEALQPALDVTVENALHPGGPKLTVHLEFRSIDDFRPEYIINQVEDLAKAAEEEQSGLSEQLDLILHHPLFQRIESTWRGLQRLSRDAEGLRNVAIEVLAATRSELEKRFKKQVVEPEYAGSAETPLAAVLFDFSFSHEPTHLPLLESLAETCATLQVVMVAACAPAFFQLKNIIHLPGLPSIAGKLQLPAYAAWRRFQEDEKSRWVCLTANRYLARETYEISTSSGGPFNYVEQADAGHPERYLWADAGWLIMSNLARSFAKFRHCVVIDGMSPETAHPNLPVRPFPKKANVTVPSPTEILIDDDKAWDIVRGGVTMLVGISDGAVASFPLIANTHRVRPGAVTTESALSYQLFAGHLSHFLLQIYPDIPAADGPEAVQEFLDEKLRRYLIPFAGEESDETVDTEMQETGDGRILRITIKPQLKIQGKDLDFTLHLSL
jgi:type VI secretion system protein ImpC